MRTLTVSVFGARPDAGTVERLAAGGVTRVIFRLPSDGRDAVLPLLDDYAKLMR
jgi:hypothetical protein